MNQEAALKQQTSNIILPENYYSKSDFTLWYNYRLIDQSSNDEQTPTERFIDSIYDQLPIKARSHSKHKKKKALNNIICNLLKGYESNLMLTISRNKNHYRIPKQYGIDHFTYTFIIKSGVDALANSGYVYQEIGYKDFETEEAENTRICATEKLIEEYYAFSNLSDVNFKLLKNRMTNANIICIEPRFKKMKFATPIQLKDENKKLITYLPIRKVRRMRDNLNEYNSLLSKTRIIISDTGTASTHHLALPISSNFYDKYSNIKELNNFGFYKVLDAHLYRVFNNGDFRQGGRFYGADYQGLDGDERKLILINEYPTVECDYKAIHPRMCYHLLGREYQEDPYDVVCHTKELRESVKILLNMMINVESSIAAIMAFGKWLGEEKEKREILDRFGLDERSLMKRIIERHSYIKRFFNSGKGLELQYRDSCIAEAILMHFTKKDIPCLCIHDSFIVDERYKDELGEVMKEEYKKLIGFECRIEFKG